MTEKSYLWTTGSVGDGLSEYTQSDWSKISAIYGAAQKYQGVCPNYLSSLACAANGANTVQVGTGGAIVDGRPYNNDAAVNVTIPSAVGGGNTRIDRIVLRADYTAQTVRITRIAGIDAGSPVAPAITQTPGVTYDVMLCQVLVTTGGTVTVTDERDLGKILVEKHQGGSSANWAVAGTSNYDIGDLRIQCGSVDSPVGAGGKGTASVTFATPFSGAPVIALSCYQELDEEVWYQITAISASGFTVRTESVSIVGGNNTVYWIAIGPK